MPTTRRQILTLAGSGLFSRIFAESPSITGRCRGYTASATVTLFSLSLLTKNRVGTGFTIIDEEPANTGKKVSIQFGAGSWPDSARGLNRLGFIHETVSEDQRGNPAECSWVAFMTTSKEKSLSEASDSLHGQTGETVAYSASQGHGLAGRFAARVDRLEFPSQYTWRDIKMLVSKARREMAAKGGIFDRQAVLREPSATFLYCVREAVMDADPQTSHRLFFNGRQFHLETDKQKDREAGAHFAAKGHVAGAASVVRLNAIITEVNTGEKTPFRLWYDCTAKPRPLRFEYQAKSFLRLTFEADSAAPITPES